jgi:hypothetical protein
VISVVSAGEVRLNLDGIIIAEVFRRQGDQLYYSANYSGDFG